MRKTRMLVDRMLESASRGGGGLVPGRGCGLLLGGVYPSMH